MHRKHLAQSPTSTQGIWESLSPSNKPHVPSNGNSPTPFTPLMTNSTMGGACTALQEQLRAWSKLQHSWEQFCKSVPQILEKTTVLFGEDLMEHRIWERKGKTQPGALYKFISSSKDLTLLFWLLIPTGNNWKSYLIRGHCQQITAS